MAPSVQQIPEQITAPSADKVLLLKKEEPRVKRQIEEEGGKTDATVRQTFPKASFH